MRSLRQTTLTSVCLVERTLKALERVWFGGGQTWGQEWVADWQTRHPGLKRDIVGFPANFGLLSPF